MLNILFSPKSTSQMQHGLRKSTWKLNQDLGPRCWPLHHRAAPELHLISDLMMELSALQVTFSLLCFVFLQFRRVEQSEQERKREAGRDRAGRRRVLVRTQTPPPVPNRRVIGSLEWAYSHDNRLRSDDLWGEPPTFCINNLRLSIIRKTQAWPLTLIDEFYELWPLYKQENNPPNSEYKSERSRWRLF